MVVEKLHIYMQKNQRRLLSHTTYKNSKRIKDLNVRPETIKLQEKNTCSVIFDIGLSDFFFLATQARESKAKINEWNYIKLKSFTQ